VVRGVFGTPVVVMSAAAESVGFRGAMYTFGGTSWSASHSVWFGPAVRLPLLGAYGRAVRWLVLYWSWSGSRGVLSLGCDAA
jgi:hypothetical protein